jgi:hypothetical protein
MSQTPEITNGNIARLEASQRILCPFCGSVAAIVAPHEPVRAAAAPSSEMPDWFPSAPQLAPVEEPGAIRSRMPRKKRVELEAKIAAFIAENPNATAEETRAEVGGRSATVAEIYRALKAVDKNGTLAASSYCILVSELVQQFPWSIDDQAD